MTIKELKTKYEGEYADIEVYRMKDDGTPHFHTDVIESVEDCSDDTEVTKWSLMHENEYDETVLANSCEYANFSEWYDDKDARVLCVLI